MAESVPLPFGDTDLSTKEAARLIAIDEAAALVAASDVTDAEKRVREFVEIVPDLLTWLEDNGREFPWRHTTDPWEVYTAEILLQRTRADLVASVYPWFIEKYPCPAVLQNTAFESVRADVETLGLGEKRATSLTDAADLFCTVYDGRVPQSVEALKEPRYVGDYSARATMLFAFGEPQPLVDVNFSRVIGRVLGYEMPSRPHQSNQIYELCEALVPSEPTVARAYSLAVLDVGAAICTATDPSCSVCPANRYCRYASQRSNFQ